MYFVEPTSARGMVAVLLWSDQRRQTYLGVGERFEVRFEVLKACLETLKGTPVGKECVKDPKTQAQSEK